MNRLTLALSTATVAVLVGCGSSGGGVATGPATERTTTPPPPSAYRACFDSAQDVVTLIVNNNDRNSALNKYGFGSEAYKIGNIAAQLFVVRSGTYGSNEASLGSNRYIAQQCASAHQPDVPGDDDISPENFATASP